MPIITVQPLGLQLAASPGVTLRDLLNAHEVGIRQVCGGNAICATCRFRVLSGVENLSPPGKLERRLLHQQYIAEGWRLSCQTQIYGDAVIEVRIPGSSLGE
jgi:adenylate cyclase